MSSQPLSTTHKPSHTPHKKTHHPKRVKEHYEIVEVDNSVHRQILATLQRRLEQTAAGLINMSRLRDQVEWMNEDMLRRILECISGVGFTFRQILDLMDEVLNMRKDLKIAASAHYPIKFIPMTNSKQTVLMVQGIVRHQRAVCDAWIEGAKVPKRVRVRELRHPCPLCQSRPLSSPPSTSSSHSSTAPSSSSPSSSPPPSSLPSLTITIDYIGLVYLVALASFSFVLFISLR